MLSLKVVTNLSITQIALFSVSAFLCYVVCWVIYARTLHPLSKIPGPFLASISRLWILRQTELGRMEYVQRDLHRQLGPLVRIADNEVACADVEAIKKIYPAQQPLSKTDFYPPWNTPVFKYPDHFSNTDERLHAERRKIVNHVYSLSSVLQSESYIDKCTDLFMSRMRDLAVSGKPVDLGEWIQWQVDDSLKTPSPAN